MPEPTPTDTDTGTDARQPRRNDAGFTLPELLITMTVSGIVLACACSALIVILRTTPQATERVAISKDITFVQTWLPVDLASASASFTDPLYSPAVSTELPGTNALTIKRFDISGTTAEEYFVAYRYVEGGSGEWKLVRYEIRKAGTPAESVFAVGVAHELPPPPPGWTPDQKPTHAVEVKSRNQVVLKPIGEDVIVTFVNGEQFATGGAGLSEDEFLPSDPNLGFIDPSAPPSRCGGTIALVLDTSGSVPLNNGGAMLETAATEFIDLFTGTPVRMSVIGFDRAAYRMYPAAAGSYFSLLNPSPEIAAARQRITVLDNRDGNWNQSLPDSPLVDGIHWDQIGSGTNWESGLHMPFFDPAGAPFPTTPDLVVFVTDGEPNRNIANAGGSNISTTTAVASAQAKANEGRRTSARIIGVLVGADFNKASAISNLKSVVGSVEYDASANGGAGNAADADFFRAAFVNTATALRAIMAAECGGTVTLQKKVDVGGVLQDVPSDTRWNFSTDIGDRVLDRSVTASITLDYLFNSGQASKTVRIVEDGAPAGYVFDRIECSKAGAPVTGRVTQPITEADGQLLLGADILLQADEALSCLVISRPA